MRVGAVENAGCAFSKTLVDASCASTGAAASTRDLLSGPTVGWRDPADALVESTEANRPEVQIPFAIIDRFQADVFTDQHGTDDDVTRLPRHHAWGMHPSAFIMPGIADG